MSLIKATDEEKQQSLKTLKKCKYKKLFKMT